MVFFLEPEIKVDRRAFPGRNSSATASHHRNTCLQNTSVSKHWVRRVSNGHNWDINIGYAFQGMALFTDVEEYIDCNLKL